MEAVIHSNAISLVPDNIAANHEHNLEDIINRYGNAILKYCYGVLCNYHDAQDAMQETFIKAHHAAKALRDPNAYSTWLYKIAYNTCLNMRRSKKHQLLPEPKETDGEAYFIEDNFIDPALLEALTALPPHYRAVFYSRAVEDMDYKQMEALYNIRSASLRKTYERAKNKLREILTAKGYKIGECCISGG